MHSADGTDAGDEEESVHVLDDRLVAAAAGSHHRGAVFPLEPQAVNDAAAAVDERLQLGADVEDIVGAGEDHPVGGLDLLPKGLKLVRLTAFADLVAVIAAGAWTHVAAVEKNRLDRSPFPLRSLDHEIHQPRSIAPLAVRTTDDRHDFHASLLF